MSKYIRIAVSVVLLSVIAWRTNWGEVGAKFANLNYGLWFGAVVIALLIQLACAMRWQIFARELQFQHTLMQYNAFYLIGMYFNLLLPTSVGGDVMRVWYLDGASGRKLAAFASVALERLNGLLILIAMACVGVLISPVPLPMWITASVWSIAGVAVLGSAALLFLRGIDKLPANLRQQLQTVLEIMRVPRVIAGATLASILVQVLGVGCLWCLGGSLGLEVPVAYYCILGPMVALLTLLPISVNGMGVREFGTYLFLAELSVNESTSNTFAFLWFATSVAVSLLGGLVYLFGAYPKAQTTNTPDDKGVDNHGSIDRDTDQGRAREHHKAA